MEAGQEYLRRYKLHGDEFLHSIVTGDKTSMYIGGKMFLTDEKVKVYVEK